MRRKKLLIAVTGTGKFATADIKTGLWLSEFTHIYHSARQKGYDISVANPYGGVTPIDPVSLKPVFLDNLSRNYWETPAFRQMLKHVRSLEEASGHLYDCIYLAGGHGAMYDFPNNPVLQNIIREHYENGRTVSAICHGVCGLLNVRLSHGAYLIKGKKLTGFSWFEEILAARSKVVPFNLEAELKARGADYRKAFIPLLPKVVVDGNLITGQDPFSSEDTADAVIRRTAKIKR